MIPKEIRRTLRLREGTPLEIFTDREGEIILKKYSPMMELNAFCRTVCGRHGPELRGSWSALQTGTRCIAAARRPEEGAICRSPSAASWSVPDPGAGRPCQAGQGRPRLYVPVLRGRARRAPLPRSSTPIICEGDAIGSVVLMSREPRAKFSEGRAAVWPPLPPDSWEGRWKADGLASSAGKSPMTNHMFSATLISRCRGRRALLPAAFQWSRRVGRRQVGAQNRVPDRPVCVPRDPAEKGGGYHVYI